MVDHPPQRAPRIPRQILEPFLALLLNICSSCSCLAFWNMSHLPSNLGSSPLQVLLHPVSTWVSILHSWLSIISGDYCNPASPNTLAPLTVVHCQLKPTTLREAPVLPLASPSFSNFLSWFMVQVLRKRLSHTPDSCYGSWRLISADCPQSWSSNVQIGPERSAALEGQALPLVLAREENKVVPSWLWVSDQP